MKLLLLWDGLILLGLPCLALFVVVVFFVCPQCQPCCRAIVLDWFGLSPHGFSRSMRTSCMFTPQLMLDFAIVSHVFVFQFMVYVSIDRQFGMLGVFAPCCLNAVSI